MHRMLPSLLIAALFFSAASARGQVNACDLTNDGTVNQADKDAAVEMALGLRSCTANIFGSGVCNVAVVQRVINASLPGGTCLTGTATRSVSLSWAASVSSGVTGYKVYRGTASGGPYTLLSTIGTATSYTDNTVQTGRTYYYVVTAVGSGESSYSNQAQAIIP